MVKVMTGYCVSLVLFCLAVTIYPAPLLAEAAPLWLSLSKAGADNGQEPCPIHVQPDTNSGQPGAKAKNRKGPGGTTTRFENEHRPKPVRTYWLNSAAPIRQPESFVRIADSTILPITPAIEDGRTKIEFKAQMSDGPMHGPNYVYATDKVVVDDTLAIRTAKWLTIHHSCGWGHKHKFTPGRHLSSPAQGVDLEILIPKLWDANFHSSVMSGDPLDIEILFRGQPAVGAEVIVTSEKGWSKTIRTDSLGRAKLTLIRDSYPNTWAMFDREEQGEFKIEARYSLSEQGEYQNRSYDRVEMVTTFSWHYAPAKKEYQSLIYGLLVTLSTVFVSGIGLFSYRLKRKKTPARLVFDEK